MIGALRGTLDFVSGNQLLIDVGGVGYEVTCTSSVLEEQPAVGEELKVVVYTDVKENAIALYGFRSIPEKEVFLLLKKVKGIGSKLALSIVSSVGAEQLLVNIGRADVSALKQVPGIGQKTAERVIVELRETVGELVGSAEVVPARKGGRGTAAEPVYPVQTGPEGDAVLALEKLGFSADRAAKAVERAVEAVSVKAGSGAAVAPGELLRLALAEI